MTEEQERAAFEAAIREQGEVGTIATIRAALSRIIDDYDGAGINAETTKQVCAALTASNVLILLRAYDEATVEATIAGQLAQEAIDSIEDWAGYASDYFKEKHGLAAELAAYRERLAGL